MTDEPDSEGRTDLDPDAGDAMHIHRPRPLHGVRELLVEIGVIVIGIVIAVGLEQAVEFFDHRHQREHLEAALQRDGQANRGYIQRDIANAQAIRQWALTQAAAAERAGSGGPLSLKSMPNASVESPDAGVWPSARASGVSNLLPSSAQNWLEYLAQISNDTFSSSASASGRLSLAYAALDQALIGHSISTPSGDLDLSTLDPGRRAIVVERLRVIGEDANEVVRSLLIYDAANDFILSTPLDQLDTPQAGKRYEGIYKQKREAHPEANLAFGSRSPS